MPRTTSYTLDDDLDAYVREQIDSGAAASASEVIRKALTHMAEQKRKEQWVLDQLDLALASPRVRPGTSARVRARAKKQMQAKR